MKKKYFTFIAGLVGSFFYLVMIAFMLYFLIKSIIDLTFYNPNDIYGTPIGDTPSETLSNLISHDYSRLHWSLIYGILASILSILGFIFNGLQIFKYKINNILYKKKQSTLITTICINIISSILIVANIINILISSPSLLIIMLLMFSMVLIYCITIFYIYDLVTINKKIKQEDLLKNLKQLQSKFSSDMVSCEEYYKQKSKLLENYILFK